MSRKSFVIIQHLKRVNSDLTLLPRSFNSNNWSKRIVSRSSHSSLDFFRRSFFGLFLPLNHSTSVSSQYIPFVKWQSAQMMIASATSVLSLQSVLYALGLGTAAVPLAATMNWIIRDGIGQFGGMVFSAWASDKFDSDLKRWRMVACVAIDTGNLIEAFTPMFPQLFLPLAACASIGKNISFFAASSSRAAINKSLCRTENLGDVTSKFVSQGTACTIVGSSAGMGISYLLGQLFPSHSLNPKSSTQTNMIIETIESDIELPMGELIDSHVAALQSTGASNWAVIAVIVPLALLHWYSCYKALNTIAFNTLNFQRFELIVLSYFKHIESPPSISLSHFKLCADDLKDSEKFIRRYKSPFNSIPLVLKFTVDQVFPTIDEFDLVYEIGHDGFMIHISEIGLVHLFFLDHSTSHDILKGYLAATWLRRELFSLNQDIALLPLETRLAYISKAVEFTRKYFVDFFENLERNGWDTKHVFLEAGHRIKISQHSP